ncbi:MAG: DUF3866 family protein [Terriglobia bacterium]
MSTFRRAEVVAVRSERPGLSIATVDVLGKPGSAVNYDDLTGPVQEGDRLIVNTRAVDLGLGTGGYHFVVWNMSNESFDGQAGGHIMKLRYTPLQLSAHSVEESDEYRRVPEADGLVGCPVIIGSLHSQLVPAVVTARRVDPSARLAYVMTDGGGLPLVFSQAVASLREASLLDHTVTVGHAYGGDFEAVNIFSGLLAARNVAHADIIVVIMGPGVVGTGTTLGFSGLEQGSIVNAVSALGGLPIAIPRLSFGDKRQRHHGVSHHTLTALATAAIARAVVAVPEMEAEREAIVWKQLEEAGVTDDHDVRKVKNDITLGEMEKRAFAVTTMGRSPSEEPEFFEAAGAAAIVAAQAVGLSGHQEQRNGD